MQTSYDQVDCCQCCSASHQADASSQTVHDLGADDRPNDSDRVESARQTVLRQFTVPGAAKKDGRIRGDGGDAGPGRHDLEEQAQPCATAQVRSGPPAPSNQDLDELNGGTGLAVHGNRNDLQILPVDLFRGPLVAPDALQQIPRFVIASDRRQVPRAVGKHLDEEGQQQGWNALKRKQESPSDVGIAIVDEGQAE